MNPCTRQLLAALAAVTLVTTSADAMTEKTLHLYRDRGSWYLVENGTWYRAASWRGPFARVARSRVPRNVRMTSTDLRGAPASIAVGEPDPNGGGILTHQPRMAAVGTDSRVEYSLEESDHDLYRLGDAWYMVRAGNWYQADSWRGPYRSMPFVAVPGEVRSIPAGYRKHWVAPGTPVRSPNSP